MEAGLAIGADLDADAVALDLAAGLRAGALRAGALRAAGALFLVACLVAAIKESPGCVCVSAAQNQTTAVALQAHNEPTRNRSSVRAALAVEPRLLPRQSPFPRAESLSQVRPVLCCG